MNTWSKWLPYPISWLRAFGLTYALTVLVNSKLLHGDSVFAALIGAWTTLPLLFSFFYWAIACVARSVLTHLPVHPTLAPVREYLTDNWSGSERSHWREGLNAFIVSFVAFIVTVFVLAYLLPAPSKADVADEYELLILRQNILYLRREMIPIGMFLVSAYLYQYDLWVRHRRAVKSAAKTKAQEPKKRRSPSTTNLPSPDPIDQELNRLRAESGMSRMKTVRPTVPEVREWYVFRSGNAEGPYTKLQLRDIQQITDRTKVRRGEADWQRAGDIPELVAYLTRK